MTLVTRSIHLAPRPSLDHQQWVQEDTSKRAVGGKGAREDKGGRCERSYPICPAPVAIRIPNTLSFCAQLSAARSGPKIQARRTADRGKCVR